MKLLNTEQTLAKLLALINGAKKELTLVTPFVDLSDEDPIGHTIRAAMRRKVNVGLVMRLEPRSRPKAEVMDHIGELIGRGLDVFIIRGLHAKLYWSESEVLVSSQNLYASTLGKTVEFGLWSNDPAAVVETETFYVNELKPLVLSVEEVFAQNGVEMDEELDPDDPNRPGHCIRCADEIPYNVGAPYCDKDYAVWARFKKPDFVDRWCHDCGEKFEATKKQPLCVDCRPELRPR